jgi:hypothetical protein
MSGGEVYGLRFTVYGLSRHRDFKTSRLQEVLIVLLVLIEKKRFMDFVSEASGRIKVSGRTEKKQGRRVAPPLRGITDCQ